MSLKQLGLISDHDYKGCTARQGQNTHNVPLKLRSVY
jgi:hypothetical protein